jgi:WD40 repeat protein
MCTFMQRHITSGVACLPLFAMQVGLWDINHPAGSSNNNDSSSSSYDGVLMFEPHRDYVSSLRWANTHTLISGSYDGTVRTLDVNTGESAAG